MPVFKNPGQVAPEWCELRSYDLVQLAPGERRVFERAGTKEKLVVAEGECTVRIGDEPLHAAQGANLDLVAPGDRFVVEAGDSPVTLVRMCGNWGTETGESGVFHVEAVADPSDEGDPVDYPKQTNFDSHFHDCDEYWVIVKGRGEAVSEGKRYTLESGDCLATGMGHHHDLPVVHEPMTGVYFETTLEGQKRLGHLWDHSHGKAQPKPDRV